ncbi:MAG TPA: CBS domain-containing protein [Syntrophorhabdaceae bacterium]|nr:CBS domain-containing protein [Syntrophorhabdaceae bacterium]HOL05675.1 CBS domain-containing protein [Syntrophorhabdaceae bacterium]HON85325.1 CBS domain-containing protein [Syntrophorhabdaceae bacterium]HOT41633.1 CBS domain-containing protein [Syntrophorhabdaceae bacterium]HPC67141.1 CBS domain-containing protein [Syntrophorhabdaceae bacterium]
MEKVGKIIEKKGSNVWTISSQAIVYRALEMMSDKGVGALIVVDEQGKVEGIITERDYARKVILQGKSSKETYVKDIMTKELFVVNPSTTLEECMGLMTEKRIRHLPVMDGGKLVGIISIGDVLKAIIEAQGIMIEHLSNYIMGTYV